MKKVLPVIVMGLLGMSATLSHADDSALKLATIKKMYAKADPTDNNLNVKLFKKNVNNNLFKAIQQQERYEQAFQNKQIKGIDYEDNTPESYEDNGCRTLDRRVSLFPYFGNGDFTTAKVDNYSILNNGQIRARVLEFDGNNNIQDKMDIDYSLTCTDNKCLIDDQNMTTFYTDAEKGNQETASSLGSFIEETKKYCQF